MLQIMITLTAASPIVLEHKAVRAFRYWARTLFLLAIGFGMASLMYLGVLFVFVQGYSRSQPLGPVVYGLGFASATLLAVGAGIIVSPKRLFRIVVYGTCGLAILFPLGVNIYFGLTSGWQPIYLLYLLGGVWGDYAVMWMSGMGFLLRFLPIGVSEEEAGLHSCRVE